MLPSCETLTWKIYKRNHKNSQGGHTQQVVGNIWVLRTVVEIADPCERWGQRQGQRSTGRRPEKAHGEGKIQILQTKDESHQSEEGADHHFCHYKRKGYFDDEFKPQHK